MKLKLVKLSPSYKKQLTEMLDEWTEYNKQPGTIHSPFAIFKNDYHDFDDYLAKIETYPIENDVFFCLDEERDIFVGAVNIRHYLNDELCKHCGHVGDGVRPSERRKGIATQMIHMALEECKRQGINDVLMTCNVDNLGSAGAIENNGAFYEMYAQKSLVKNEGVWKNHYWFHLADSEPRQALLDEHCAHCDSCKWDFCVPKRAWCDQNAKCGGCTYGGYDYRVQLREKERRLKALLAPVMSEDSVWEGMVASPLTERYKNKMEYSFGDEVKDGPLTLGMHRKKSFYSVLTCADCHLVHEDFNRIVQATVIYFQTQGLTYRNKRTHEGFLRHLLLRRSFATGDILADLVTSSDRGYEAQIDGWKDMMLSLPLEGQIKAILHTKNDSPADIIEDQGTEVLFGEPVITEMILGLRFDITPFSFFQTNSKGAETLYTKVREYVGDTTGKIVYDLYSGTGTIAQIVSPVADHVYGVEIVKEAVEAAKVNAQKNGLTQCDFIAGDVLEVIDRLKEKPDLIILDPPRDGLHPKMLPKIAAYGVDTICYIACKPASFVRDMEYFAAAGYKIARVCGVDQFPYTKHVETVCLLSKVK